MSDFNINKHHQPLRILEVIWGLKTGGAERIVEKLSIGLTEKSHEVHVAVFNPGGAIFNNLKERGIRVHLIRKRHRFDFSVVFRLAAIVRSLKIDIINTHLITADIWGRLAGWLAGVPVVVTEHAVNSVYRSRFQVMLDTMMEKITAAYIAVSESVAKHHILTQGIQPEKFNVIYNGIEPLSCERKRLTDDNKSPVIIGTVSRFSPEKNLTSFIMSIAELRRNGFNVAGLLVGSGPEYEALKCLADSQGVSGDIWFYGETDRVADALAQMDIFLNTSKMEGFSVAVVEAMSMGLPVVANDVGGNTEAVIHGETGYIVTDDDMTARLNVLAELVQNQQLRRQMGTAGKLIADRKFTYDIMIGQTEQVYSRLRILD